MAREDMQEILAMFGTGAMLSVGGNDPATACALRQHGALVDSVDALAELAPWRADTHARYTTLVVEASAMLEIGTLVSSFAELYRIEPRWVVIRFSEHRDLVRASREVGQRRDWENAALQAGFRRAPQAVSCERYVTDCNDPGVPGMLEFERIPAAALTEFPFEQLLADRNLHMDMSREAGERSDAHMVRYALAAALVRPGDTVLDCACGLGYGSAILAAQSGGARYIGVDIDAGSTAYARANFGEQYGIEYVAASATDLSFLDDDSVDLLVTFETIEHLEDYDAFLDEALRVLRPDGRIIASVPNLWVDDTGNDPNPYHFHAFDYAKFRAVMGTRFLLEERYAQSAPGGFKLCDWPRTLEKLAIDGPDQETEWLILVGAVDPLVKAGKGAASGTGFDNPWLLRSMVTPHARSSESAARTDLAARVLGQLPMDSADFGAALTVLAEALLSQPGSALVDDLMPLIDAYLGQDMPGTQAKIWQLSSAYMAGQLALARGERDLASMYLTAVARADFLESSPALAAKCIAAAFELGMMALADNDDAAAAAFLRGGVDACKKAQAVDDVSATGLSALSETVRMGARCALALELLPLARRNPGQFWRQVNLT